MSEAHTKPAITFIFESTIGELSARQSSRRPYLIRSPSSSLLWQRKMGGGWVNGSKRKQLLPFCLKLFLYLFILTIEIPVIQIKDFKVYLICIKLMTEKKLWNSKFMQTFNSHQEGLVFPSFFSSHDLKTGLLRGMVMWCRVSHL